MLDNTSYDFVYCFIICLLLIALIYSLLRLENLKPEYGNNAKTPLTKTLFDSVYTMYGCIRRSRASHTRLRIILLVAVLVILQLCTTGESDIMFLFVKLPVFDWSTSTYGYFRGLENFTRGLAVLTILPLCTSKLQASDTTLILAGLLSKLIGLIILAFAATTWQMFLVPLVGVLQGFPSAAIRSTTSKMVNQNEQGTLFGIIATAENVASFSSTLIFNELYPATIGLFRGFCFILEAFLTVICVIVIFIVRGSGMSPVSYEEMSEEGENNSSPKSVVTTEIKT